MKSNVGNHNWYNLMTEERSIRRCTFWAVNETVDSANGPNDASIDNNLGS
jgi:hypothetical protein